MQLVEKKGLERRKKGLLTFLERVKWVSECTRISFSSGNLISCHRRLHARSRDVSQRRLQADRQAGREAALLEITFRDYCCWRIKKWWMSLLGQLSRPSVRAYIHGLHGWLPKSKSWAIQVAKSSPTLSLSLSPANPSLRSITGRCVQKTTQPAR